MRLIVVLVSLALGILACRAPENLETRAADLERTLMAPCCWRQTLRDHESEPAAALRAEIRARLAAGESPDAITAAMVARYGEAIRAMPEGDPTWQIAAASAAVAAIGLLAVLAFMRRRVARVAVSSHGALDDDALDRLDDELRELD